MSTNKNSVIRDETTATCGNESPQMVPTHMTPTRQRLEDVACCAHLTVKWRTEPCDGYNIRGEIMPGAGSRGWWECTSGCGIHFAPMLPATPEEVEAEEARQAASDGLPLPDGLKDPYRIIDKLIRKERLEEIREREKKATPVSDWEFELPFRATSGGYQWCSGCYTLEWDNKEGDRPFIEHARSDILWLLDRVAELEAGLNEQGRAYKTLLSNAEYGEREYKKGIETLRAQRDKLAAVMRDIADHPTERDGGSADWCRRYAQDAIASLEKEGL